MNPYKIEIKNNPQDIHHEGIKISNFKKKILREIEIKCKIQNFLARFLFGFADDAPALRFLEV